jgi:hypothetical protein
MRIRVSASWLSSWPFSLLACDYFLLERFSLVQSPETNEPTILGMARYSGPRYCGQLAGKSIEKLAPGLSLWAKYRVPVAGEFEAAGRTPMQRAPGKAVRAGAAACGHLDSGRD